MPKLASKRVRIFASESPLRLALESELQRLGFLLENGPAENMLCFVHVRDAADEPALLAIGEAAVAVAILDANDRDTLLAVASAGAKGIVDLPVRRTALAAQIELALSLNGYERRLKMKIGFLERTLKTRRETEKATQVLATVRGISSNQAYQLLRRIATQQRKSVADVANEMLNSIGMSQPDLP